MRSRWPALLIGLAFVAVACGGGGSGDDQSSPGDEPASLSPGDSLPDTEFELVDGTEATVGDVLDGRPLVLNFFASWCAPCVAEMPEFQAVFSSMESEVAFFGIALQDTKDAAEELVELTEVTYPWGLDDGLLYAAFRGFAMPTTVYISADGEIVGQDNGQISEDRLRSQIGDLFGVAA